MYSRDRERQTKSQCRFEWMQACTVEQHKDINNLNAESSISIELYIVVSTYDMIKHTKYQQKCRMKSDMKIEMKISDKYLEGSETKYSKYKT